MSWICFICGSLITGNVEVNIYDVVFEKTKRVFIICLGMKIPLKIIEFTDCCVEFFPYALRSFFSYSIPFCSAFLSQLLKANNLLKKRSDFHFSFFNRLKYFYLQLLIDTFGYHLKLSGQQSKCENSMDWSFFSVIRLQTLIPTYCPRNRLTSSSLWDVSTRLQVENYLHGLTAKTWITRLRLLLT